MTMSKDNNLPQSGAPKSGAPKSWAPKSGNGQYRFIFFSELYKRPVCTGKIQNRIGKVADLVFRFAEPYPEAVGIFMEYGWGKPTQFVPWDKVIKIDPDVIMVLPREDGLPYPPFQDQPGWILINEHLMGRTILDIDGRTIEVVNDVHLLESKGRMIIVHVDISFNGFLRRWGLKNFRWIKDRLITWKYVQPLSLEDAISRDTVTLSVTHNQLAELPSEDLADALEELSGDQQQAFFSVLDNEKAAETLIAAEPRTQRQLIADLRKEKARAILEQMSVPQLASLLSVLPYDDRMRMLAILPEEDAARINTILSEHETTAQTLMSDEFVTAQKETAVAEILHQIKKPGQKPETLSYVYIVDKESGFLLGVVDLRDIVLAAPETRLGDLMTTQVVAAEQDDDRESVEELFAKYHFRMLPVVDAHEHLLGVIRYNDIMTGLVVLSKR